MADVVAQLEQEAAEIRERIEPKREEIRSDEEQLARLEAALDVLRGNVALATRSRPTRGTRRGVLDDETIVAYVRTNQPASARDIGGHVGVTGNPLSVKLGRMVKAGLLTKTGERRNTRYSVAT